MSRVVILGGGPGGYEAALVAAQLGAEVTLVDRDGLGGSAVLTDCVPSKALVATATAVTKVRSGADLGVLIDGSVPTQHAVTVDLAAVNDRILGLATAQSEDIRSRLVREGVQIITGTGRLTSPTCIEVSGPDGVRDLDADAVLIATGARPRVVDAAPPDGERILTWEQVYDLPALPERLIVVGSGVTGAEFASAYDALGSDVVLVSSRDRVLPTEDADAAEVLEGVFARRGITVLKRSRAVAAARAGEGVQVSLEDGRVIEGSHVLMAVGSLPNTNGLGLDEVGVRLTAGGFIEVDRVSRTSVRSVYAAGDCTGVLMLASVAAMQGRIAMWHALGDAVAPLDLSQVSSTVFTDPEIASVGQSEQQLQAEGTRYESLLLPLATNARAKMQGLDDGFVKLLCRRGSRIVIGGVVVASDASELVHAVTMAVDNRLTVDQVAATFTVYPSLSGSIAEAARRMHLGVDVD